MLRICTRERGHERRGKKSETPSSQLSNTDDRRNGYAFDIKNEKKNRKGGWIRRGEKSV